ncbi:PREDICTED: taste receptor type 1 member 3 isoform X5 [Chinchilla lanigera]|uniref:taste receptor type 1 member 3 isoform X5 n=1 Tax=Chinchilla lanigera TaxID=34839 RepID=UPI0006984CA0|nr:PREDICTED: taste receptor type 1 member 3 isoform X5 [Chinchilla lanigera]
MPGLAVLGLSLVALLGLGRGALLCLSQQFRMEGDYILGGLFPLGLAEETDLNHRTRPDSITCSRYGVGRQGRGDEGAGCPWACAAKPGVRQQPPVALCVFRFSTMGLFLVMALKMAVEEINNSSTLLPGLQLGYDLFDTCSEPVVTMKPSLMFLAKAGSRSIAAYCNYTQYQPRVLAVIGPHSSELALITGKFFGFFLMPQVSYGASMDRLSNRETFPSFFRTVTSNRVQLEAMVTLLQHFGWNWVAALEPVNWAGAQPVSWRAAPPDLCHLRSRVQCGSGPPPHPALQHLQLPHTGACEALAALSPPHPMPQLLDKMYNMSFHIRGLELRFSDSGNVDMEYDLKMWVWQSPMPKLRTVGTYNGSLQLQPTLMHWHAPNNQVPVSQCSQECREGQVRRVKGFHSCCYDCVDCKAGSYRQNPDDLTCTLCDQDQWSPERSMRCFPRRPRFLEWGDPAVLLLLLLLALVLGLVLAALGLFIRHRDSPLVQASGGPLACFGLACLGLVCLSVLLFPGWPGPASCLAQQPVAHLPLTGCLSTLFLQAAETFVESELPPTWVAWVRGHLRAPWAWLLVLLLILMEAALCGWSLAAFPSKVEMDWRVLPREVLVHCHMHSWVGLGLVHITNATLAFLCFLGTFLVQSQPGHYNRARALTFTMLAYFVTWVSFVPLFTNMQVLYQPAVQMGAILLCALGILAIFHLPKCYLLLWWPELNTPEFFLGQGPNDTTDGGGSGGRDRTQGDHE